MMGAVTPETCKSDFAVNKCLHTVASSWTFLLTLNHDARNHKLKKKNCAPSWVYLEDYTRMHGQQNIKYIHSGLLTTTGTNIHLLET